MRDSASLLSFITLVLNCGQGGKGAPVCEITRDKKIVWKWADHTLVKAPASVCVFGE